MRVGGPWPLAKKGTQEEKVRRRLTVLVVGIVVGAVMMAWAGVSLAQTSADTTTTSSSGRYIVVLKDTMVSDPGKAANEMAKNYDLKVVHVYRHALKGFSASVPSGRLKALREDGRVLVIAKDKKFQAISPQERSATATPKPQLLPDGVDRIQADKSSTRAGNHSGKVNVGVAVVDTGIYTKHPDLNVAGGVSCVSAPSRSYEDLNGHGTHAAGTVGAKDNAIGVVGVAPGTPLYAVRILNEKGIGTTSNVLCGVAWVTSQDIPVANMSLSAPTKVEDETCALDIKDIPRTPKDLAPIVESSDVFHLAICISVDEGTTYVVAAGNENQNFRLTVPAHYDEVLTVTAMADNDGEPGGTAGTFRCYPERFPASRDDTRASFSNFATYGSENAAHTIAAPGECILSTWSPLGHPGAQYNVSSGTSMASPHVAGTVALCIDSGKCAGLSPRQIIDEIRRDAAARPPTYGFVGDPYRPNGNRYYGYLVYAGGY